MDLVKENYSRKEQALVVNLLEQICQLVFQKQIPQEYSVKGTMISRKIFRKDLNMKISIENSYRTLKFDVRSVPFSRSSSRIAGGDVNNSELKQKNISDNFHFSISITSSLVLLSDD
jgi:hypothetical protein